MPPLEAIVFIIHIPAAVVSLVAGAAALVTTKGGRRHRQAGKLFVVTMVLTLVTVPPLLALDPTDGFRQFLTLVAVFTGYFVFTGYRALPGKRPRGGAATVDWIAAGVVVIACLGLAGMGVSQLLEGSSFGVVMAVFGLIGGTFGVVDIRRFQASGGGEWLDSHLTRMMGAFIADVTAGFVINLEMLPIFVTWLGPTIVGVPLIIYWRRTYGTGSSSPSSNPPSNA